MLKLKLKMPNIKKTNIIKKYECKDKKRIKGVRLSSAFGAGNGYYDIIAQ